MNNNGSAASDARWLYDSPVNSEIEAKLRRFLVELKNTTDKILGIQVCAYKDGKVIIDTAAGVLGKDDPRAVQPDSLFPVFSVTKGVTAGLIHWLADKGKLKLDENVANFWPEFGTSGKDQIKVNHVLNHTAGLHNALAGISENDLTLFCDFDECVKRIAMVAPETEPGCVQLYHYLSYGWLCGGIIEHASGKKFQDILEEAIVRPLNIEGELYIGIPPGVESRLATLTIDTDGLILLDPEHDIYKSSLYAVPMPSSYSFSMISSLIPLSNTLNVRRSIQPASNGHFSARALARYYATLVDGGVVPPCHPSSPLPPFESRLVTNELEDTKIFNNPKGKIHDALLGGGDYKNLTVPNGLFGLGFLRFNATDGSVIGVGHPGLGGSTGYCDINNRFAIAVTVNKLSLGALTGKIIKFVCLELNLPVPQLYDMLSSVN
ncbi:putative carboxylesterase [Helianthus annuus]|nr:putative carboxylesterase [Helianthus annuus]